MTVQHEDEMVTGRVVGRTVHPDGKTHGKYNDNPYLNSMKYDVEFPDGQTKEYAANTIAENIMAHVDQDGYSTSCLLYTSDAADD